MSEILFDVYWPEEEGVVIKMSSSSLWVMDKKLKGNIKTEFKNSWLFTPIALDILFYKYMPWKRKNKFGDKINYLVATMFDNSVSKELNSLLNNSETIEDRIVWELCSQQVFFSKNKEFISECIIKFLETNKKYMKNCEEYSIDRFKEIAKSINDIDINDKPYFIFKNSSCDDNIEYWFRGYNEEKDEYFNRSLLDLKEYITEFVIIENKKIINFVGNINFKEYMKNSNQRSKINE